MHVILLTVLASWCFVQNGSLAQQLPTVALTGEPRVIARRIWRGRQVGDVLQQVQSREPFHEYPVNANFVEGQVQGRHVTVYSRILRPAKLVYTGGDVVTEQWMGGDDNNERQEFFRMPQASAIQEFRRHSS